MQYLATIKKKSPMHGLWRRNKQYKARFLDTLFTFNKATGQYYAEGNLPALGRLMRHPHVVVTVLTEPVGETTPPAPATQDSVNDETEEASNS